MPGQARAATLADALGFHGDEAPHLAQPGRHDADEDRTGLQSASDLVPIPAACHPVCPVLAARGTVPEDGWRVNVEANRH